MAPSATPSKKLKAETMRAEAARKMKEMEAAIKQAEIEEELERQQEEEEASKRQYEEAMWEAMEAEKKQKATKAVMKAAAEKVGESTKEKGKAKAVEVKKVVLKKKSKRTVDTDNESEGPEMLQKKKAKVEGNRSSQIEVAVLCLRYVCISDDFLADLFLLFRCKSNNLSCQKSAGQGQACAACNQNKQKCKGVQWVAVPGLPNLEELTAEVAGFREDTSHFLENIMTSLGCLMAVMGEIADNQRYYTTWKMEESRSVGSLRMTAEYSELEELALWQKFHKWQRDVAEQEGLNRDSKGGVQEMVIDEDEVGGEEKEFEEKEDEGEEGKEDEGKEDEVA